MPVLSKPAPVELSELPVLGGRKSLAEEAADTLRDLILLEQLAPGTPVPERELAGRLEISRTPLREALRILEIEGLIEFTATRRPYVANPTQEELNESLNVLGALEALAGELACQRATDEEIEEIGALCRRMVEISETGDTLEFFRTDMAFHDAIVKASRNTALAQTHRQYNAKLWRARFISSKRRPDRPQTLRQHREIHEALARRDVTACSAALRSHLESAIGNIAKAKAEIEIEGKDE